MEKLIAYLKSNQITQTQFALRVGTTQATISRLAKAGVNPSPELALAIEAASDGFVPFDCWFRRQNDEATR